MNWLKAFVTSSVGRKYLMAATGLFLCLFLVIHLAGNMLLYVGDEAYNDYAHKLHDNPEFLILAEVLLYAAFIVHIVVAIGLQVWNRSGRDRRYAYVQSKREDRVLQGSLPTPDRTMFLTGFIGLMFIIVHVSDFKFEFRWETIAELDPYEKARLIVADFGRGLIYLVGSLVLAIHVTHGLQSSLQSLGWNHPKYMPTIRKISWIFGLVVAVGFGSFPVMAWL